MSSPENERGRLLTRRLGSAVIALSILLCLPNSAWAWGVEGHEVIALIAERLLTPKTRERLALILALEPGATLSSISNWADRTRNRSAAPWHYVNLPRDANCVYSAPRDCPDGRCVVAALQDQSLRLASFSASLADKREALKYVVHLMGDIHQPLHAAFADDRGGNTYQVQAFGHGTNLHALWDTGLLRQADADAVGLSNAVVGLPPPTSSLAFAPERWAMESCRIASRPDFYPGHRITQTYLDIYEPVAETRLLLAGYRLASLLNATFDPDAQRPSPSFQRPTN
ncbi:MAG: S1/P1 nuclease [Pseudomonadota bacterium]|nr:S1/P1 nuclease [Pseudomonadota bacterium]